MLGGQLGLCRDSEYNSAQSAIPAAVSTVDLWHTGLCVVCVEQGQLWYVGNLSHDSKHGYGRMDEDTIRLTDTSSMLLCIIRSI